MRDLVDQAAIRGFPAAPLLAVDRPEVAVFVGPLVPDADAVRLEVGDVGIALQEPQQLVHDRLQVQLLGRHHREALGQIETHLPAKDRARAGAGAVGFIVPVVENVAHQVEVGLHRVVCPAISERTILHRSPDHRSAAKLKLSTRNISIRWKLLTVEDQLSVYTVKKQVCKEEQCSIK